LSRGAETFLAGLRHEIRGGADPLGDAFCRLRPPAVRRSAGAVYTPPDIVDAMASWAADEHVQPARVLDPGAGSGRFLGAIAKRFPLSELIAVEKDPLAALILRANAAVLDYTSRLRLLLGDYREIQLPGIRGTTLFIGNPPYVRHHGKTPVAVLEVDIFPSITPRCEMVQCPGEFQAKRSCHDEYCNLS
jgi:adenine-specific DNA-methyltransferase